MAKPKSDSNTIALNKRASHDYHFLEQIEAGLSLQGWEIKSLRQKKVQITQAHVLIRSGEAYLFGAQITPLPTASSHIHPDPTRSRKLLLHKKQLRSLVGAVERQGQTIIPLKLYWKKQYAKLLISLARGKKKVDKRHDLKEKDWSRQQQILLKRKNQGD